MDVAPWGIQVFSIIFIHFHLFVTVSLVGDEETVNIAFYSNIV